MTWEYCFDGVARGFDWGCDLGVGLWGWGSCMWLRARGGGILYG